MTSIPFSGKHTLYVTILRPSGQEDELRNVNYFDDYESFDSV